MSTDGRRWAFYDQVAIYTPEGRIPRSSPREPVVSDNGPTTMYAYGPDGDMRFVVNGREYGPFQSVWKHELLSRRPTLGRELRALDDNKHYVLTESGRSAPTTILRARRSPLRSGRSSSGTSGSGWQDCRTTSSRC